MPCINPQTNHIQYRPFSGGVASWLATGIYVGMVTSILYNNSYSPNDFNLKYESYQPFFFFFFFMKTNLCRALVIQENSHE